MDRKDIIIVISSLSFPALGGQQSEAFKPPSTQSLNPKLESSLVRTDSQVTGDRQDRLSDTGHNRNSFGVITSTQGGIEITSVDGEFSTTLGGRILTDAAYYREDKNNLGNGTELRNARLELDGRIFADFAYELSIDFADGDADLKDAWLSYDAIHPWRFTLGHFKEPFSLEELTSRKYLTFMERALPNAMVPGRNMGIGVHWSGEQTGFSAGLFGNDYNDDADDEGDEGWGVTSRLTYAPIAHEHSVVHLGLAASHRKIDDEEEYRIRSRPESHLTDIRYLDSGKIVQSRELNLLGLEVAWVYGPVSLQGEWMQATLKRDDHKKNQGFDGWYLQGSWFPTGESRHYKSHPARFGRVKPLGEQGALELALRFSTLDLNDQDIEGGESDQLTFGVNWHFKPQIRVMMNYILVENDHNADADGDVEREDVPEIIQLRAQVDFN
jgi:phosphate-selective porin OprO/OprP